MGQKVEMFIQVTHFDTFDIDSWANKFLEQKNSFALATRNGVSQLNILSFCQNFISKKQAETPLWLRAWALNSFWNVKYYLFT